MRDPHVQRQEKAAWITLAQAKLSKDLRAERSKQLKKVLLSGNSGNLLYGYKPGTSEPLSVAQVTRLNTQAFAVLRMYETFDMFEQRCEIPAEGAVKGAALMVGQHLGYNEKTVRGWLIDYETDGFFAADSRGKAERELMILEEDLQQTFCRWMRKAAKDEALSVDAALVYLNTTLLPDAARDSPTILDDYNMTLPICRSTAWFWMVKCRAVSGKFKQSNYNDHHESASVLKDKLERYIPAMDRDELRQPLWVQLSAAEYQKLAVATGNLPPGRPYVKDCNNMFELHVDASDHFDAFRAAHPLGGDFSIFWEGRPTVAPSAPPLDLPDPGVDTLAASATGGWLHKEETAAATTAPAASPTLTKGQINAMTKLLLEAACDERGLLRAGLKNAGMKAALRQHYGHSVAGATAPPTGAACEDCDDAEKDAEYEVNEILEMHVDSDNVCSFRVSWVGYSDISWEPEHKLGGCEAKLGTFFSDPAHRAACQPANLPTCQPANLPTCQPASLPTCQPGARLPTCQPANPPTSQPANLPTSQRQDTPTCHRVNMVSPSSQPANLTNLPTCQPANLPTCQPANLPPCHPANLPTCQPANLPTCQPANLPTCQPANLPTCQPANLPTCQPANLPTC